MFRFLSEELEAGQLVRYQIQQDDDLLSYADVLSLWSEDSEFRKAFTQTLTESPFSAFRWETPSLTTGNKNQPFEFVLVNAPGFTQRKTDQRTYQKYFTKDDAHHGIVSFENLGGDATLIVPSPRTDFSSYGHLASFLRSAPTSQVDALWRRVGEIVSQQVSDVPLWLNTAGGGVAWLHVRLDSRPKYYSHRPYRDVR